MAMDDGVHARKRRVRNSGGALQLLSPTARPARSRRHHRLKVRQGRKLLPRSMRELPIAIRVRGLVPGISWIKLGAMPGTLATRTAPSWIKDPLCALFLVETIRVWSGTIG